MMIATITSIIVFLYQSVARTKSITSLHPHHLLDDGAPLSLILTLSIRHEAQVVPEFLRTLVFARPRGDD
ncbi:hypothetical protein, partial [uncultured Bifidobacterium sp.]|uniref:hypothetical protein n=1 Tax=uncultured Bifidobacterium sp. TaxID=165187 RepID=UPI0025986C34